MIFLIYLAHQIAAIPASVMVYGVLSDTSYGKLLRSNLKESSIYQMWQGMCSL